MADAIDINFLKQAIEISKQAPRSADRYSVGAIVVDKNRNFICSGFTQEFGESWHAEAVALKKAFDAGFNSQGSTVYTSMEPCSVRNSGKKSCCQCLIEEKIDRVVFALPEPPIFVVCDGKNKLAESGIVVEQISSLENDVVQVNSHLLLPKTDSAKANLIILALASLFYFYIIAGNPSLAQGNDPTPASNTNMFQDQKTVAGGYYTDLLKQFAGLNKTDLQSRNLIDSQGKINDNQLTKDLQHLPVNNDQLNKSMTLIKGLIYDPSNPTPFFNSLIALQSLSVLAQAQLIPIAEKTLGSKNKYVIELKQNYDQTLKYVEALKQQKILLEQTIQSTRK